MGPYLTISIPPTTPGRVSPGQVSPGRVSPGVLTPGFLRVLDASVSPCYPDGAGFDSAGFGLPFSPATLKIANAGSMAGSDGATVRFGFDMGDLEISKLVLFDISEDFQDESTQACATVTSAAARRPSQLPIPELASGPQLIVTEDFLGPGGSDFDAIAAELRTLAAAPSTSEENELPSCGPPAIAIASSLRTECRPQLHDTDDTVTPARRTSRGSSSDRRLRRNGSSPLTNPSAHTAARRGATSSGSGGSGKRPRKKKDTNAGRLATNKQNCWLLWLQEHRGIVAARNPSLNSEDVMAYCSDMWHDLLDDAKLPFQMMSRFKTEVQAKQNNAALTGVKSKQRTAC